MPGLRPERVKPKVLMEIFCYSNNDDVIFRAIIIDVTLTSFAVSVLQSGKSLRGLDVTVIS